jgi:hypothetical protein
MFQNAWTGCVDGPERRGTVNGTAVAGTTVSGAGQSGSRTTAALNGHRGNGVHRRRRPMRSTRNHVRTPAACNSSGHRPAAASATSVAIFPAIRPRRLPDRDRFTRQRRVITILGAASAAYDSTIYHRDAFTLAMVPMTDSTLAPALRSRK